MEIKQEVIFDSGTADKCFSVRKQRYIEVDGKRVDIDPPDRCTFAPGEFDKLNEYAPELYDVFQAIWTPDVIEAWNAKQVETQEP